MDQNVFLLLKALLEQTWRLFTGWYFPGTRITPAAFGFFCLALEFGVWLLKRYFLGGGDSDD